jgi:hypothetical protein
MLNIVEETQLFASVTARVYCPAGILIRSWETAPVFQK